MADPAVATPPAPAAAVPAPAAQPTPAAAPAGTGSPPAAPAPAGVAPAKPTLLEVPPAAAAPSAPVKQDYSKLKLPDGTKLQAGDLDTIKAWGEKHNLAPEAVQAALEERSGAVNAYHDSLLNGHKQTVAENRKKVESHPTLGGANLKATNEAVTQVLEQFAPPGLMERIQQAGYHYDPDFLQFLMNVHGKTKSDTFVAPGGVPRVQQPARGLESMYEKKT